MCAFPSSVSTDRTPSTPDELQHQAPQDTVHFLSPATTARTECEYDGYLYSHFARMMPGMGTGRRGDSPSTVSCIEPHLVRTLLLIKPAAVAYRDVVLRVLEKEGIHVLGARHLHLTPEQVSEFYAQHYGSPGFPYLVVTMSSEPVWAMSLCGMNVVERLNILIASDRTLREEWFFPRSMHIRFGLQQIVEDSLHASESLFYSNKENRFFFPENILEPITCEKPKVEDYINLYLRKTLVDALAELIRVKPVEPIIYLAEWLLLHNPFQPNFPYNIALAPT